MRVDEGEIKRRTRCVKYSSCAGRKLSDLNSWRAREIEHEDEVDEGLKMGWWSRYCHQSSHYHFLGTAVALPACKRVNAQHQHSPCQCPQQCLFLNGCPTPTKIRSIPLNVQIGHNSIKSFCFNLSVWCPGTAGASHTHKNRATS